MRDRLPDEVGRDRRDPRQRRVRQHRGRDRVRARAPERRQLSPPLVVTLAVDDDSQARLQALRDRHFPPERNVVPAHVSLFHALPGDQLDHVLEDVRAVCARAPFDVAVTGVRSLGRGAALTLRSDELHALRGALAARFTDWLTPQDRQRFQGHVTVQNKVTPQHAAALVEQLQAELVPWRMRAVGVSLWRYLHGPWEPVETLPFEL